MMTETAPVMVGRAAREEVRTPLGPVLIQRRCLPETLDGLAPDPGLGAFGHYLHGSAARQHAALCRVARLPEGHVTAAFTPGRLLVGFVTFHPPWDLAGTGLTKGEYRDRIVALFKAQGFELYTTNEPNIRLDRANALMIRAGRRVSPERFARFAQLLFA
jgi:hypothetical protein